MELPIIAVNAWLFWPVVIGIAASGIVLLALIEEFTQGGSNHEQH